MPSQFQTLNVRDEDAVRVIELNRPDALNAFNAQMGDDLVDAFRTAASDDAVKVIVLTGAGRAFWAGADLKEMSGRRPETKYTFDDTLNAIIDCPKPLMLAINGVGVGIGATVCGLADFVFMAESARLRCPFSSLGLTAEAASTVTFPRLLGRQRAAWFLMSAEWMDANMCLEAGLAMEIIADQDLLTTVMTRAQTLAALPSASLQKTKSLIMGPLVDEMRAAIKAENQGLAALAGGPANKEALAAFRDKREADFSNF